MSLSTTERRVADSVAERADALLSDLAWHVAQPTGGGNLDAIEGSRAAIVRRLERLGASTKRTPGDERPAWLGAPGPVTDSTLTRFGGGTGPRVLIAGHLDTVHDPQGPFLTLHDRGDGTATGPGCVDMKGGLVIAMHALELLAEAGVERRWSFFLNADEETGTYCSGGALRSASGEHDLGIALEPALPGGELAIERGGSGQFMVEIEGRSAHVGRAFAEGVSAVTALGGVLVRLGAMAEPGRGRIVNVGPISGGHATNVVPDRAVAWGNVRFGDDAAGDALRREIASLATAGEGLPRVRVATSFNRPAKPVTPATERLGLAARVVAEDLGQRLPFARTGGVCDGNTMQAAGLPTIDTLGVRGGGLHTPGEWIELRSLVERCQLLAVLLMRLGQE
jgi:glutamate carboxypeptidase